MADRIYKEFREISTNPIPNCGITVGLIDEKNFYDWTVTLIGPKDTSYKGGLFHLNVHFPPDYPNKPPEVFFVTPIYHVNVNPTASNEEGGEALGHVCISTLNWWKPEYKMKEVLTNIYSLFYMANPDSAYGLGRAKEYKEDRETYEEKAKYFTQKYAKYTKCNKKIDRNQNWDFNL